MAGDLSGGRALVTGAGSGIGQAATAWACDVRDGDQAEAMVEGGAAAGHPAVRPVPLTDRMARAEAVSS